MTTQSFLQQLEHHADKSLLFEYIPGKFVGMNYHITEIKNTHVQSVDCGANSHEFDQTVVQLWISESEKAREYMSAGKAKKIFDIVSTKTQLVGEAEIFFEYGDEETPVIVYPVSALQMDGDRLVVKLGLPTTACKPKLALANLVGECKPGGGCC